MFLFQPVEQYERGPILGVGEVFVAHFLLCLDEGLALAEAFGEMAIEADHLEKAALRLLCGGVGVTDTLGDAAYVRDAVPRGTDDGSDFSFESSEDSLFDFTHDN